MNFHYKEPSFRMVLLVSTSVDRHLKKSSKVQFEEATGFAQYAIELDDVTHEQSDRRKRDIEVERIFKEASLPLVHFRNKDISESEIIQALSNAMKISES